ncbi:MAG: tRNA (N6-isopentenyl adenosine(37)-C2)-methylthiotransferase MiaB [Bacillota bacterium]|nr:tRNA (N6-isopentenyl adenosine(37)-C2)-methylthiotransferase MiaB [Bacillota bacterium]
MDREITEIIHQTGQIGEGKRYLIITLGCQMNEHDSEVMAALLESIGYSPALAPEDSDLILINTCAVRKKPEDKVASLLGKFNALKQENRDLIIAVAGCMSQQSSAAEYLKERFHHVDLIFGTHALPRLPLLIEEAISTKKMIIDIEEDYTDREGLPVKRLGSLQAWLPVIYGCNNFCSYCIVPHVRGRERSRLPEEIIKEAETMAVEGYKEITLLGQNVNSYGNDLPGKPSFAELLRKLDKVEGLERIRFMTSHPKDLSLDLINAVKEGRKICEHFHLPVQSGSNRILEKMNRRYTREHYLDLVHRIREAIPGVAITSDLIVGFPGETEQDLIDTADLLEKARFDNAFSFIYSPRKNTTASELTDELSRNEKEERLQYLNKIQHRISREINNLLKDQVLEVLVEGYSKTKPEMQTGRTRTNKLVHFKCSEALSGKLIWIKITEARTWNLGGIIN